jgi:hypothetical protein
MIRRAIRSLKSWITGGERSLAQRPLVAGYRREISPGVAALLVALLALSALWYGLVFSYYAPARLMPLAPPLVLIAAIVIWLLPAGDYAPTRLIEPSFIAFFAALLLWPNYLAIALPGLPWLTMLRVIGFPLVLVLLICLSVSSLFRSRLMEVIKVDKVIFLLFVGLVFIQTFTLILSQDFGSSINRWLIAQVNMTSIFVCACIVFTRVGFAEYWCRLFIGIMFIVCTFGLWENRLGSVSWGGHIPSLIRIEDPVVQRILAGASRATTGIQRVQGTSSTPLGLAELLGLSIPFAVHFIVENRPILVRLAAAAYMPFSIYIILLTDSRLGLVATLASLLMYVLLWAILRWQSFKGSILGPAVVLAYPAFFVAAIAASFTIARLRNEIWGNNAQASSTEARFEQWAMGFPKFLENPIGHGPGTAAEVLGFANGAGVITIDTYYLSVLLELGIFGVICYFGLFLRGAWLGASTVIKTRPEGELRLLIPFSVSIINFVIVKSVFSQEANHPLVFMMLGAVVALTYRTRRLATNGGG